MVQKPVKNFQWVSNKVFDYTDFPNERQMVICYETGISENDFGGITTNVSPRVSIKLRCIKTSNSINIELEYCEVASLTKQISAFSKGLNRIEIKSFVKNNHVKTLSLSKNQAQNTFYLLLIEDSQNKTPSLQIGMDISVLCNFTKILVQIEKNWIQNSLTMYSIVSNHRMILELTKLNTNYIKTTLNKNIQNTTQTPKPPVIEEKINKNNTMGLIEIIHPIGDFNTDVSSYIEETPEEPAEEIEVTENLNQDDLLKDFYKFDKNEILSKELELEKTTEETEIPEDEILFDVEDSELTIPDKPALESKFVINDEYLNGIDLNNPPKEYVKPIQSTTSPRPFFNNFIEWDIEYLYKWLSAFSVVNENSKDLTFLPLELILTNSIGKDSFNEIKESKDYYYFQYNLINNLKTGILKYINDKDNKFNVGFEKFEFTDVKKITDKNDNIYLWNFIVDISLLNIMYRYFLNSFNKLNVKEQSDAIYNVILTEFFTNMVSTPLIKLVDKDYLPELSKDVSNLYLEVKTKGIFENLSNIFSHASMGGNFNLEFEGIYKYLDKFIETISNFKISNSYSVEINSLEDIKKQFISIDNYTVNETDKKLKVFNKVLETELIDNTDFINLKSFSDIDIIKINDPKIIKIWKLVKDSNSNIKISEIKRKLVDDEESEPEIIINKVETKEPVETKTESFEIIDMFSIEDTDDFDIYNLI